MKKVLVIMLMLFCLVATGCAKVTYTIYNDGITIKQNVTVEYDKEDIESKGATLEEIVALTDDFWTRYMSGAKLAYESNVNNLYITEQINASDREALRNAVVIERTNTKNEPLKFIYSITYNYVSTPTVTIPSENVFYLFNYGKLELDEQESSGNENQYEEKLFTITVKNTSTTIFSSVGSVENYFLTQLRNYNFTLDDVAYVYESATPYRRLHSDCDEIRYENGMYIHKWNLESSDEQITLFRTYANTPMWYAVAIGGSVIAMVVIFVICTIKKKKKVLVPPTEQTPINDNN